MEKKFEDVSKNVMYTAVGAVVIVAEKTQQILEECRIKGQEACEKYGVKNEELKRHAKETFQNVVKVTVVKDENEENQKDENEKEDILDQLDKLSEEDLARVKEKLSKIETKEEEVSSEE